MKNLALYIHSPFCRHKCGYCDFNSWAEMRREPQVQWLNGISRQLQMWSHKLAGIDHQVDTIFWGGGTPSLIENDLLLQVGAHVREHVKIAANFEWTVECNPETLNREKLTVLADMGATRISIGIQSFQDRFLERLERQVRRSQNLHVLELVAKHWPGPWSLDMMFALPTQTLQEWEQDLNLGLSFGAQHISAYQLTLGTARSLTWKQPGEDELETFYNFTSEHLQNRGLNRYEVSNFAVPGFECRHNLKYWRLQPFLSVGPGGAGLLSGTFAQTLFPESSRFGVHQKNPDTFETWLKGAGSGPTEATWLSPRTAQDHLFELLMMGLRLDEGIARERLQVRSVAEALDMAQISEFINKNSNVLKVTTRGRLLLHTLLQKLYERLEGNLDFENIDPTFI